ncbi:MAG TPA: penicillin acylase family protein, partial [Rhodothermales bacterium]|nr:penicillin acylase family protein [Rhodothermales bacterium]
NNWVAHGTRTATGAPILAGDMHLSVTLPSIWYEVHLVTPTMNTYGVTTPGTPLPVEAFTDHVAWAFTNTGADVIDHYALELDSTGTRYRYDDGFRDLRMEPDTILVAHSDPVIDTIYFSHWGPVMMDGEEAVALRWAAHEPSRTMTALWGMHHARNLSEFEDALRYWDTPMQNIAQADVDGNIAIRSTGFLPIRRSGNGVGLLDGSTDEAEWVGRVPFEELPHSNNPAQGFLSSANQQPTDASYPYYLGHDWRSSYRSLRIDSLLRGKSDHTVEDFQRYQADVHAMQYELFVPLLDSLTDLSSRADSLRQLLAGWDGNATVDRPEPLVLDEFLDALTRFAWDESAFQRARRPAQYVLYGLLVNEPASPWLDIKNTTMREDASALLRYTLNATADTLEARYGWGVANWRWGDYHHIVFKHLTQSSALGALWRGPVEYPGFASTLSPAGRRETTHTASWRVVVDFSQTPPVGYGMYPGGQSGNPFSPLYDAQVMPYVQFQHYDLHKPTSPDGLAEATSQVTLRPPSTP